MTIPIAFALEYSLGHATHADNLKRVLASETDLGVAPVYLDLPYHGMPGAWTRLPLVKSNWSVRASLGALVGLGSARARDCRAALFHTQVTSLFSVGRMQRGLPSVISLDATPLQYDAQGALYGHEPGGNARLETFKKRLNERAFGAAKHLVTWSEWTKASLVSDYGVAADKITVIPPGIDRAIWQQKNSKENPSVTQLLFVGGDFGRKGGEVLLDALRWMPPSTRSSVFLHIVTKAEGIDLTGLENVRIYRGLTPNAPALLDLFALADIFVFPTRADCLPLAVMEALASGLPIITTAVGALPEAVTHGETGLIVPPDDAPALAQAIIELAGDGGRRRVMSENARTVAAERFDAQTNYRRLVLLVKGVAG